MDGLLESILGRSELGVAITDPDRILASPFENYDRRNLSLDAQYFVDLVASERIVGFIVGLPIHTDGKESQKSTEAREFGQWLGERCNLPIEFFDERYTSAFANQILASGSMTNKKKEKEIRHACRPNHADGISGVIKTGPIGWFGTEPGYFRLTKCPYCIGFRLAIFLRSIFWDRYFGIDFLGSSSPSPWLS